MEPLPGLVGKVCRGVPRHAKRIVISTNPLFENLGSSSLTCTPMHICTPQAHPGKGARHGLGDAAALTACLKSRGWEQEELGHSLTLHITTL